MPSTNAYVEKATFQLGKLNFRNSTAIFFHDCPKKHFEKELRAAKTAEIR